MTIQIQAGGLTERGDLLSMSAASRRKRAAPPLRIRELIYIPLIARGNSPSPKQDVKGLSELT